MAMSRNEAFFQTCVLAIGLAAGLLAYWLVGFMSVSATMRWILTLVIGPMATFVIVALWFVIMFRRRK